MYINNVYIFEERIGSQILHSEGHRSEIGCGLVPISAFWTYGVGVAADVLTLMLDVTKGDERDHVDDAYFPVVDCRDIDDSDEAAERM